VNPVPGFNVGAIAADVHDPLASLASRNGDPLNTLNKRLNEAVGRYHDGGEIT
jgi:hypothetical protein